MDGIAIECVCPRLPGGDARHPDGDRVRLRERLDFRTAATMQKSVALLAVEREAIPTEEVLGMLSEAYLRYGIESWTVVDGEGEPVSVTPETVEQYLLPDLEAAMTVAEQADERYGKVVLRPLLARASRSSQPTPTTPSTSVTSGSPSEYPTPLRPSSTSTTQTDATETTSPSPDGDSSSSPSSVTAA